MIDSNSILNHINEYIQRIEYHKYPSSLYEPIKYVLSLGGKRIRPQLMLMAYNLYRDDIDTIMPNACALEMFHNFTLLHDDLMDNADMRRGNPTVHVKWHQNAAILSGDTMLLLAYNMFIETLSRYEIQAFQRACNTFCEATLAVSEGQQYDIDFETRLDVTEDEYIEMIRLKTSVLLACALKIGAELASASVDDAQNLYDFGEKIGLAFQLQDDLLDVYGDPSVFGKKIGGDILCNKKTYMLINALQLASNTDKELLLHWINKKQFNPEDKIAAVTTIYDTVGIRNLCKSKIEYYFEEAINSLSKVGVSEDKKLGLKEFAYKLLNREK